LQAAIDALEVQVGSDLQSSIAALESADLTEKTARMAADSSLQGAVLAEATARQAADQAEQAARQAADAVLSGDIVAEAGARQTAILAEQSARIAADAATLASAQTYADNKVAALVDSAPGALDTLNELAAALGNDANFASTVVNQIAAESSSRQSAVDGLDARLDVLEGDDTVNGSVAKALQDAKDYADAYLSEVEALIVSRESDVADAISNFDGRLSAIDASQDASSSVSGGELFTVDSSVIRSFVGQVSVFVSTLGQAEVFSLMGVWNGTSWIMSVTSTGDDTGVSFSMSDLGVISFSASSSVERTIKYKYFTTTI
jgi:small-conductance mechanosensitive channel